MELLLNWSNSTVDYVVFVLYVKWLHSIMEARLRTGMEVKILYGESYTNSIRQIAKAFMILSKLIPSSLSFFVRSKDTNLLTK